VYNSAHALTQPVSHLRRTMRRRLPYVRYRTWRSRWQNRACLPHARRSRSGARARPAAARQSVVGLYPERAKCLGCDLGRLASSCDGEIDDTLCDQPTDDHRLPSIVEQAASLVIGVAHQVSRHVVEGAFLRQQFKDIGAQQHPMHCFYSHERPRTANCRRFVRKERADSARRVKSR